MFSTAERPFFGHKQKYHIKWRGCQVLDARTRTVTSSAFATCISNKFHDGTGTIPAKSGRKMYT